jgi:hypothetical protein
MSDGLLFFGGDDMAEEKQATCFLSNASATSTLNSNVVPIEKHREGWNRLLAATYDKDRTIYTINNNLEKVAEFEAVVEKVSKAVKDVQVTKIGSAALDLMHHGSKIDIAIRSSTANLDINRVNEVLNVQKRPRLQVLGSHQAVPIGNSNCQVLLFTPGMNCFPVLRAQIAASPGSHRALVFLLAWARKYFKKAGIRSVAPVALYHMALYAWTKANLAVTPTKTASCELPDIVESNDDSSTHQVYKLLVAFWKHYVSLSETVISLESTMPGALWTRKRQHGLLFVPPIGDAAENLTAGLTEAELYNFRYLCHHSYEFFACQRCAPTTDFFEPHFDPLSIGNVQRCQDSMCGRFLVLKSKSGFCTVCIKPGDTPGRCGFCDCPSPLSVCAPCSRDLQKCPFGAFVARK